MNSETGLEHLQMLSVRFSYLGVWVDLAALSIIEAWGVYLFLRRLNGDE